MKNRVRPSSETTSPRWGAFAESAAPMTYVSRHAWRLVCPALLCLAASCAASAAALNPPANTGRASLSAYPATSISNAFLNVRFYLPDAKQGYYRGTRFEWSGMISSIESAGHRFFSEFRETHDPLNHDDVCGTAEEFDISNPPGYERAKPGETFLKIGVGLLEKPNSSPYSFTNHYRIARPGVWTFQQRPGAAVFRQVLKETNGWAYEYTKTLELSDAQPRLTIRRELRNTGLRPFATDHYGHNFIKIDDAPAGPDYRLEFPFDVRFGNNARTQGCLEILGNRVRFLRPVPDSLAVWTTFLGYSELKHHHLDIKNTRTGATIEIVGDRPLTRLAFYSSNGVLCPEPFVHLSLEPGEVVEWSTTYRFEVEQQQGSR